MRWTVREVGRDCDIGDIGHPKLVGTIQRHARRKNGADRLIVIAVRRRDETPVPLGI